MRLTFRSTRMPALVVSTALVTALCLPTAVTASVEANPQVTTDAVAVDRRDPANDAVVTALDSVTRSLANGAAAGYRKADGVLWVKSAGTTSRSSSAEKVNDKHAFRAASITKPMTAMIALMEVDAGRLKMDTTVESVLPGALRGHGTITLQQLLTHTSGMPCHLNDRSSGFWRDAEYDLVAALRKQRSKEEVWGWVEQMSWSRPGTKYTYSNAGYITIGAMIEKVTGKSMKENIESRILQPLGMTSSRYVTESDPGIPWVREYRSENGRVIDLTPMHMSVFGASASLASNPTDLTLFWQAFLAGKIVSKSWVEQMMKPNAVANTKDGSYGIGLELWKLPGEQGLPAIGHTGGAFGTLSYSFIRPSNGAAAVGHVSTRSFSSRGEDMEGYRGVLRSSFAAAGVMQAKPRSGGDPLGDRVPLDMPFMEHFSEVARAQGLG